MGRLRAHPAYGVYTWMSSVLSGSKGPGPEEGILHGVSGPSPGGSLLWEGSLFITSKGQAWVSMGE